LHVNTRDAQYCSVQKPPNPKPCNAPKPALAKQRAVCVGDTNKLLVREPPIPLGRS
jgi:hypothetical protein